MRADQRVGVGEVERRRLVPLLDHAGLPVDGPAHALDVLLEGDEVAHRGGLQRRQQPHPVHRHGRPAQRLGTGLQGRGEPRPDEVEHRRPGGELVQPGVADDAGADPAVRLPGGEPHQTGGATNRPLSGSLKDLLATNSFIAFAVPHWSETSGFEKS